MKQAGASPHAIAAAKIFNGEGFIDSFKEMGRVDLADLLPN
jgi:hypothetical protein